MRTLTFGWLLGLTIVALHPAARADDCNGNGIDDAVDLAGPAVRGYWRFEETAGPVLDSGPNGLVGTATNADASDDVSRGRIPRTGEDNVRSIGLGGDGRVVVPDPAGRLTFGGTGFTIEAWVRIDTLSDTSGPNQRQFLVQKKGLGAADTALDYAVLVQRGGDYTGLVAHFGKTGGHSGRELMVLFGTGGGTWAVTSNLEITDTGWHHVAVSHDGAARTVRFAVDGRLETIEAPGPAHATNGGPLVVGAHTSSSGAFNQFLRGAVDELRVLPGPVAPEQWLPSHAMADCNANAMPDGCDVANRTSPDCDADGQPEECQLAANDCDLDGMPDDVLLAESDCNGNGVLDACDIASGFDADANGNGRADSCEDCNGNRSLDPTDIKLGLSDDCDGDGVPDECGFGAPTEPTRYAHDDGVQEANLNFVGAVLDFAWMNRFTVVPGGEWISAVEVVWGDTYPDLPAEVVLWSDPDGDGNPTDARVIVIVATRSMKIDFPTDNLNVVAIPPTWVGPAGTSFFVGVHFDDIWGSGRPVALDLDPPHSGQGWIAYQWNGPIDLNHLAQGGLLSWPHHDLLVRAIGSDGQFANDCDANGTLDACDVAGGGGGDRNRNGVPDACEAIGDLDGDGRVTAADLTIMLGSWGGRGAADLDGDGTVGPADLALLLGAWTG